MTMNPLPPQAYTKDTLLKAYHWLQHQGPSIKEMALTPDILVSLYLKASRDGENALDRPSVQNFKNELKSLAGMMGELDVSETAGAFSTQTNSNLGANMNLSQSGSSNGFSGVGPFSNNVGSNHSNVSGTSSSGTSRSNVGSNMSQGLGGNLNMQTESSMTAASQQPLQQQQAPVTTQQTKTNIANIKLDPLSEKYLNELREKMNLSSNQEALRWAIKLAHNKTVSLLEPM